MNEKITQEDLDLVNQLRISLASNRKVIRQLEAIGKKIWTQEILDSIFDPKDTCLCSNNRRMLYKQKFYIKWDELITEANSIL